MKAIKRVIGQISCAFAAIAMGTPAYAQCAKPTIPSYDLSAPVSAVPGDPTYPCLAQGASRAFVMTGCVGGDCRTFLVACNPGGASPSGGGGQSTPYLFTRAGGKFLIENDVMNTYKDTYYEVAKQQYEQSSGDPYSVRDEDYYKFRLNPEPEVGFLRLLLKEIEPEESHIDQIRLVRVIHPKDVYVFADEQNGGIRAVREKKPAAPVACTLKSSSCLEAVSAVDDKQVEAVSGEEMSVQFDLTAMDRSNVYLVVHAWENEVLPPQTAPFKAAAYSLVPVVIVDPDHPEKAIQFKHLHPRQFKSGMEIGLGDALKGVAGNRVTVKLRWTAHHYVDFIGLLESTAAQVVQEELLLKKAIHSDGKNVKEELLRKDKVYAHTVRGEQIELLFTLPPQVLKENEAETYFFVSSGFYHGLRTYLYPKVDPTDSYKKELTDYVKELTTPQSH